MTAPTAASALFQQRPWAIVFATDGALSRDDNASLANDARTFVRNGGTLIFCGAFANTKASAIDGLFERFGLSWETGECQRTSHEVNETIQTVDTSCLSPSYSQQALHLRSVEPHDRVYQLSNKSHVQSTIFPPSPIEDLSQTPAALASCGKGRLGFQGDVNGEPESIEVLLAMCGLR